MSIDYYPASELDHALTGLQSPQANLQPYDHQQVPQQHQQHHQDRFSLPQDHSQYDLFAANAPAQSNPSSFQQPRYRSSSSASESSPHSASFAYAPDFLYPHSSSVYSDNLNVNAPPSNPFDLLSGIPAPQPAPPVTQTVEHHVHPYHRPGASYTFNGTAPTVAPTAVNTKQHHEYLAQQQNGFSDVLVPERRSSTSQVQDYSDEYGLASALSASIVPSPMSQYHDRVGNFHSDNAFPSAPLSVPSQQQPKQEIYRNGTSNGVYDQQLQFMPQNSQAELSLRMSLGSMTVDETLSKMKLQPSPTAASGTDLVTFVRPYLQQYVSTPNRIALGERSVIVMSSKVAQKSYGTEKRFLCPPPTAILIGNSWWSEAARRGEPPKLMPPRVVVSISGEPAPAECTIDWTSAAGKPFDAADPPGRETTFIGRCVGKQLFISEVDEKKKKVEALINVAAPNLDDSPERVIGLFRSRPIKVISKPSKKRQSAKNLELCINHGSTISLFHRLRSQTVSTKYLCVSGSGVAFKGSDGAALPGVQHHRGATPSFVARTSMWDPFILYIVDVTKPAAPADTAPPPPPSPDYPSPPPNAIAFTNNGSQIPIYYNQTVVLQCLTSGVVSPVLIIRKVDHATIVVGGGLQDGAKGVPDMYCAPGEVCGDPVSQLHKIAFEVYDPTQSTPEAGHPGVSGSFLSCMGEKVNTYRPEEGRQWNSPSNSSPASHSPSLPGSPVISTPTSASSSNAEYFSQLSSGGTSPTSLEFPSSDGGRVKRSKRGSLSRESKSSSKGRRSRQNSTGSLRGAPSTGEQSMTSGALWAVDVGETSIWTIVGTDQVRYNFYVPPSLYEPNNPVAGSSGGSLAFPVPLKPVTPFPDVVKYLPPDRAAEAPKSNCASSRAAMANPNAHAAKMLTVYGANFSKTEPVTVFFGADPSPLVEIRCTEVLACLPPENKVPSKRPIVLVRGDGVVFPSNIMYP